MFHAISICSYSFPLSPCIISQFSVYKKLAERTAVKVDVQQAAAAGRFGPGQIGSHSPFHSMIHLLWMDNILHPLVTIGNYETLGL